jgi:aryl-alcohol dehydrogenase-like predicted oxidoreductase
MKVSELGFGAWGIGGKSYGTADKQEALRALAKAEEFGCNFVDTAEVYGDSERIIGEFLQGRRDRWLVSTKFSGQKEGIVSTVERQLKSLRIDEIDFYQIHWVPRKKDFQFYEDLYRIKQSGKVRYIGVSLYNANDIDYVLSNTDIDGFQVSFSLLDPDPFLSRLKKIREKKIGVIVRSALKSGFLTGKYAKDTIFNDPDDQRQKWSRQEVADLVELVEEFRFLEKDTGSMLVAAVSYPLMYPEVSTVLLGTKTVSQAETNFGTLAGYEISDKDMEKINMLQTKLRLQNRTRGMLDYFRKVLKIVGKR